MDKLLRYIQDAKADALLASVEAARDYARPLLAAVGREVEEREGVYHRPVEHAETVAGRCYDLLPVNMLGSADDQLRPVEAAVLAAAAWLHEVGLGEPGPDDTYNVRSARAVWDSETEQSRVAGLDPGLTTPVAKLCLAHRDHRKGGGEVVSTLRDLGTAYWQGHPIRVPLLAALFRLACRLEVHQRRYPTDLGPNPDADAGRAWVTPPGPVEAVVIDAKGCRVDLRVRVPAGAGATAARRWCDRVNAEFAADIAGVMDKFQLPYRPPLLTYPESIDTDPPADGSWTRFRQDAVVVLENGARVGAWALGRASDGCPFLDRTVIDGRGVRVRFQIAPTAKYPDEAPTAKAIPRIENLRFTQYGHYDAGTIKSWAVRGRPSDRLLELCEELRPFADPERMFAADADIAAGRRPGWVFVAGTIADGCRLVWRPDPAAAPRVCLRAHLSYPLAPPRVEAGGIPAFAPAGRLGPGAMAELWDSWIQVGYTDPLNRLLAAIEPDLP